MSRIPRWFAIGFLAAILLLAHGYPALVGYTVLAGPQLSAEVTSCHKSGKSSVKCSGQWHGQNGESESGVITGARKSNLGQHVTIRTGPLGAYTDDLLHMWLRMTYAVIVDGSLVWFGLRVARIRRLAPVVVARFRSESPPFTELFTVGKRNIGILDGAQLFTIEDAGRLQFRFIDSSGVERWRLRGQTRFDRSRVLMLQDRSGAVWGSVHKDRTTVSLLDASGAAMATIVNRKVHAMPGLLFVTGAGLEFGRGVSTHDSVVIRLRQDAPEILRLLIFGYIHGMAWLALPQFRKPATDQPAVRSR